LRRRTRTSRNIRTRERTSFRRRMRRRRMRRRRRHSTFDWLLTSCPSCSHGIQMAPDGINKGWGRAINKQGESKMQGARMEIRR
jgi:hypothetical protein